ncbi:adenylyl-sulfate kinase [Thermodesulfobacteriota bacterium]
MNLKKPNNSINPKDNNVTWHQGLVTQQDREKLHGHKGAVIWFTGLSASGKSTIAHHLEKLLHEKGCSTYVFDGDNVRHGLCGDLGFTEEDRSENIRRIGEMTKLFVDAGIIAITAFISPYRADRQSVRALVGENSFIEVFVDCPVDICEKRDQKGIYAKARSGAIKDFTGISAPYQPPNDPSLVIRSNEVEAIQAAIDVMDFIKRQKII